jgi:hypothetical protein
MPYERPTFDRKEWHEKLLTVSVRLMMELTSSAWVCHEIGRSFLEMGNFARSKLYGIKVLETLHAASCTASRYLKLCMQQALRHQGTLNFAHSKLYGIKVVEYGNDGLDRMW